MKSESVEPAWEGFAQSVQTLRDKWVPAKLQKQNNSKWVNRTVAKGRRAKDKAWVKYQGEKTEEKLMKYKEKLRISVAANRSAKINYEQKLANNVNDNSKSFFAYVRSKQRRKDSRAIKRHLE